MRSGGLYGEVLCDWSVRDDHVTFPVGRAHPLQSRSTYNCKSPPRVCGSPGGKPEVSNDPSFLHLDCYVSQ